MKELTILLVDDHEIVRAGFRSLIVDVLGMKVVGEARSGEQALELYQSLNPDLVILDMAMPGIGGEEVLSKMLSLDPDASVIVLTYHEEPAYAKRIIDMGAKGYLTKRADPEVFLDAVRTVVSGKHFVEPTLANDILFGESPGSDVTSSLTAREFEVFLLLAQGMSVVEISNQLQISPKTVGTYQTRIFQKCKTGNLASLTRLAIRNGFIEA